MSNAKMITPSELRKCAVCVFVAADEGPADDISRHLNQAADAIENLETRITELEAERELFHGFIELISNVSLKGQSHQGWHRLEELKDKAQALLSSTLDTGMVVVRREVAADAYSAFKIILAKGRELGIGDTPLYEALQSEVNELKAALQGKEG